MSGIAEINMRRGRLVLVVVVIMSVAVCAWAWARSAATVPLAPTAVLKVDTSLPGNEFAPGAVGLGTEAKELGTGHLTAARTGLVRLMRLLGPSVLRIGGNSVDLSWCDQQRRTISSLGNQHGHAGRSLALQGLLTATGWKVLLGVDLVTSNRPGRLRRPTMRRRFSAAACWASRSATSQTRSAARNRNSVLQATT